MFDKITARSKGFFYGWWMVAVGCGMRMLGGGFHLYGFTIFILPRIFRDDPWHDELFLFVGPALGLWSPAASTR